MASPGRARVAARNLLLTEAPEPAVGPDRRAGERGLSLVCIDDDPNFKQLRPSVSHIRWSRRPVAKRIVRWVNNISQGKEDTRQTMIKAEFIEGGTIGPVGSES